MYTSHLVIATEQQQLPRKYYGCSVSLLLFANLQLLCTYLSCFQGALELVQIQVTITPLWGKMQQEKLVDDKAIAYTLAAVEADNKFFHNAAVLHPHSASGTSQLHPEQITHHPSP